MISRLLPGSHKFYLGLVKFGLKRAKKSTGADIIGFRPDDSGQLKPDPMKVVYEEGPANAPKYKAKSDGGKYEPGPADFSSEFIGKTPVGFFVDDPPRQTSLLEGRVRDAIDMEQFDWLVSADGINVTELHLPADFDTDAIADGGQVELVEDDIAYRVEGLEGGYGPWDASIDLSADGDGARVSWFRTNDILHERATTEEMQMQEERGLVAGRNNEELKKFAKLALLAIVLVVAIFVLGPPLVKMIFGGGGGGGGGGGIIPIFSGMF